MLFAGFVLVITQGLVLFIQISPSSGRLQLVDATGSIDVIVPDLPSGWKSDGFYEVISNDCSKTLIILS